MPFHPPRAETVKRPWTGLGRLNVWVSLLCSGCIGYALVQQGQQLTALRLTSNGWLQLALATVVSTMAVAVNAAAWAVVLRWLKTPLPLGAVLVVFARTNVLKYIPGGVWHLVGRLRLLHSSGQGLIRSVVAVLLDPLLMAIAALLLVPWGGWQSGLAMVAPAALLVLLPRWRDPLLLRMARRSPATERFQASQPRRPATDRQTLPRGFPWLPLLAELSFVLTRFAGFALCTQPFLTTALGVHELLAAFALAWAAGLVIPGAPAGLGVFEVVLMWRLGPVVPAAPLLATALAYRLISTLADALAAALAEPWRQQRF